jgi:hypothetical protein
MKLCVSVHAKPFKLGQLRLHQFNAAVFGWAPSSLLLHVGPWFGFLDSFQEFKDYFHGVSTGVTALLFFYVIVTSLT